MISVANALPPGPLIAWYGDDFTGSAAVSEVLTYAGLPSVLFLAPPTAQQLAQFEGCRGIGIAGVARSCPPEWMDRHLPPVFEALAAVGAPIIHYKSCSTNDSAPHLGSIGHAYDLAAPRISSQWTPLVVAAPPLGRYQTFGNLFVRFGDRICRLDRHPTMSRHPQTPMDEADCGAHLARQTAAPIGLIDLNSYRSHSAQADLDRQILEGRRIISLDMFDRASMRLVGELVWENRGEGLFAIGSQGIEYALVEYWRSKGWLPASDPKAQRSVAERIAVVSGSCSHETAAQILAAQVGGADMIHFDAVSALDAAMLASEIDRAVRLGLKALREGRDPIIHTALGPDDAAVARFSRVVAVSGQPKSLVNERLGQALGEVFARLVREGGLRRGAIFGGDTSGHAMSRLGVYALTPGARIAPGCGLLTAWSRDRSIDGLQLVLKGGQMGPENIVQLIRVGDEADAKQGVPA